MLLDELKLNFLQWLAEDQHCLPDQADTIILRTQEILNTGKVPDAWTRYEIPFKYCKEYLRRHDEPIEDPVPVTTRILREMCLDLGVRLSTMKNDVCISTLPIARVDSGEDSEHPTMEVFRKTLVHQATCVELLGKCEDSNLNAEIMGVLNDLNKLSSTLLCEISRNF